jgi:hypothetical protein
MSGFQDSEMRLSDKFIRTACISGAFIVGTQTPELYNWLQNTNYATLLSSQKSIDFPTESNALLSNELRQIELEMLQQQPSRSEEIMRFGYPGFDNLRIYEVFCINPIKFICNNPSRTS